jgi:hypothetical protein
MAASPLSQALFVLHRPVSSTGQAGEENGAMRVANSIEAPAESRRPQGVLANEEFRFTCCRKLGHIMNQSSSGKVLSLAFCVLFSTVCAVRAQGAKEYPAKNAILTADVLRFVVIVSRHGVRSPTGKLDELNHYSSQPWPLWSVPPGYLTEHGAQLMTLMGAYDRALLAEEGLLTQNGCEDAARTRILADSDQRTRETGRALATGLAPGCNLESGTQVFSI